MSDLAEARHMLAHAATIELSGTVLEVKGLALSVGDLPAPIGAQVRIAVRDRGWVPGEVVGFDRDQTIVMLLASTGGIRSGDRVVADQFARFVRAGESMLGRVVNAMGKPIDGLGPIGETVTRPLRPDPVDPLRRPLIDQPLATGVRAVDAMLSVGRGQRLGIFASPGLGKSTLLGTMAKHTSADVSVISLVGERGREVLDFVEKQLGKEGLKRSVVVCATGDEPAVVRVRAAMAATSIAEYFRDQGADVLLIMDSVTRFCQAQRQVGLASGEPPATKGYPPSVFSELASLLERSGRTQKGSITGLYSVLVEGDDMSEPIADAARGILDGHVVLSQRLASRGHYPAIDVLDSISRVADDVTASAHQEARREVIRLLAAHREVEDLVNIGAYAAGSSPEVDLAIAAMPVIEQLLRQGRNEQHLDDFARTSKQLLALVENLRSARQQMQRGSRKPVRMPA